MRPIGEISEVLDSLNPSDFDYSNPAAAGLEVLYEVCDELSAYPFDGELAELLFRFLERMDGVELGHPGPVVHLLERWPGRYEMHLRTSISHKPTPLTVWMVNRVLNAAAPDQGAEWLDLLESALSHPRASAETVSEAQDFLAYQCARDE